MKAIPTKFSSVQFRSRLEAKWAAFFDLLGWPWEYEPIDLNGYIPDFILPFPHAPLLLEVKPCMAYAELDPYTEKIAKSGWDKEAVVVGAMLFPSSSWDDFPVIGIHREAYQGEEFGWDQGLLFRCSECGKNSIFNSSGHWRCRVNGCYDGDHYLDICTNAVELWREAGNLVQWRAA